MCIIFLVNCHIDMFLYLFAGPFVFSMFPKSTHETFSNKLYQTFKTHKRFVKPKLSRTDFTISHYAGEVCSLNLCSIQCTVGLCSTRIASIIPSTSRFSTNLTSFWTKTKTTWFLNTKTCWVFPNALLWQAFSLPSPKRLPNLLNFPRLVPVLRYLCFYFGNNVGDLT